MSSKRHPHYLADLLVIGYGNVIRRDDGVGPRVAEAIEALRLPRVWTLALPQLAPEHAECLARVKAAIFVDASADGGSLSLSPLQPAASPRVTAHTVSPPTLLAIARSFFDRAPAAWILTVPAADFSFGDELSPLAANALPAAISRITDFASRSRRF